MEQLDQDTVDNINASTDAIQKSYSKGGDIEVVHPSAKERSTWDKRSDGSEKGLGYFGVLKRPDGMVSSELSVGVNLGGKEVEIPLIVPTLSREELSYLLKGGKPTPALIDKAAEFAQQRMQAGKPFFADDGEQRQVPAAAEDDFRKGFGNINGKRVPNPNPSVTPPPIVGGVRS